MPVHSGYAHCLAALYLKQIYKALVYLSGKHHLHYLCGLLVSDPKPVHKNRLLAYPAEHFGNFRTAAVYQHDLYAYKRQENYILHYLLL